MVARNSFSLFQLRTQSQIFVAFTSFFYRSDYNIIIGHMTATSPFLAPCLPQLRRLWEYERHLTIGLNAELGGTFPRPNTHYLKVLKDRHKKSTKGCVDFN